MPAVLLFLTEAMKIAPLIIQAGKDIAPFAADVYAAISGGGDPSDEAWASLKSMEANLRNDLQKPV